MTRTRWSRTRWFRGLVALLSAGWVAPMWQGLEALLDFVHVEAWPLWLGETPVNAFPFLAAASGWFSLAFLWLGLVIFGWAWAAAGALGRLQA